MKNQLKQIIKKIPIAFTKNQQYDKQTKKVILKVCKANSNAIDVGCLKGEILDIIRQVAPEGRHFGFEPIPELYQKLEQKYKNTNCTIHELALSNTKATANFNYVVSNPSYSGLRKRKYDHPNEKDLQITVNTDLLDNIIPENIKIDFIKIDVEGGEYWVLEGAKNLLRRDQPIIIFEHGLGASEFYDASPEKVFALFESSGYQVSLMKRWLENAPAFTLEDFKNQFYDKLNYYFIAYPQN